VRNVRRSSDGHIVYNACKCAIEHFESEHGVTFEDETLTAADKNVVCTGKIPLPCCPDDLKLLKPLCDDSMQEGSRDIKRMAHAMVRIATYMACVLQKDHCTVQCKMSRSRSPAVIAAFFAVFRGQASSLDALLRYMRASQQEQRPRLTEKSNINFPNFSK
jgi:hypothetical protein